MTGDLVGLAVLGLVFIWALIRVLIEFQPRIVTGER